MKNFRSFFKKLSKQTGASLSEVALLTGLIAIASIPALDYVGFETAETYCIIGDAVADPNSFSVVGPNTNNGSQIRFDGEQCVFNININEDNPNDENENGDENNEDGNDGQDDNGDDNGLPDIEDLI